MIVGSGRQECFQIPCFETRTDGLDNIIGALILAGRSRHLCLTFLKGLLSGNYTIPEVTVYFDHKLMRGNRTVKVGY